MTHVVEATTGRRERPARLRSGARGGKAGRGRAAEQLFPDRMGERAARFRAELEARVVGQAAAVEAVSEAWQIYRSGLASPDRPLGSFLFLGPTGTGKTNLVEALAEVCFGDRKSILKVDCAEFSHSHEIARLIGSPPGYLGHQETQPFLSQANVDRFRTSAAPFTLLLFDEIEKANDSLWQLLLGVLDKARLTLGNNKEVDLSNCFVFMTSNVGSRSVSDILSPGVGFAGAPEEPADTLQRRIEKAVLWTARRTFPPEFLNRIDHRIVFQRLDAEQLERILALELDRIGERLSARGVLLHVEYAERLRRRLLAEGTDLENGARPLRRVLERRLVSPFARLIASGQLLGGESVVVDWPEDAAEVEFRLAPTRVLAAAAR